MSNCHTTTMPIIKKDGSLKCHPRACRENDCPSCATSRYNILRETVNYIAQTFGFDHFACLTANPHDPDGILQLARNVEHDLFCLHPEGFKLDCMRRRVKFDPKKYNEFCENILKNDIEVQFKKYKNYLRQKARYPVKISAKEEIRLNNQFRQNALKDLKKIQSLPYGWLFIRVGELQLNHRIHFHYVCNGWVNGVVYQYTKGWKGISYDEKYDSGKFEEQKKASDYIIKYAAKSFFASENESWQEYGIVHDKKTNAVIRVPQVLSSYIITQDGAVCTINERAKIYKSAIAEHKKRLLTFAKEELRIKEISDSGNKIYYISDNDQETANVKVSDKYIIEGIYPTNPRQDFQSEDDFLSALPDFKKALRPTYTAIQRLLSHQYGDLCKETHDWTNKFLNSPRGKQLNLDVHSGKITKKEFHRQLEEKQRDARIQSVADLYKKYSDGTNNVCAVAAEFALSKYKVVHALKRTTCLTDFRLTIEQENFVTKVQSNPITLLDGQAGTGKTHAIAAMITAYSYSGMKVLVTSVSSKAVMLVKDTLSHVSNHPNVSITFENTCVALSSTINNYYFSFIDPIDSLPYDLIIVDEVSMMPIQQLSAILSCARFGTRFVFCGDFGQLPPVGSNFSALSFLVDMNLPICSLTKNMRSTNKVVEFAKSIRQNSRLKKQIQEHISTENFCQLIEDGYQIITNTHREINNIINRLGKHPDFVSDGLAFSINDKCLTAKNLARDGILNGTEMTLIGYKEKYHRAVFALDDGRHVDLPINDGLFVPGVAITVHKSQGSEYEKVAIVIECRSIAMCNKNWLYTAVTRAKSDVKILFDFTDCKGCNDPAEILANAVFSESVHYSDIKMKGILTILNAIMSGIRGDSEQEFIDFKKFLAAQLKNKHPKLYEGIVNNDPDLLKLKKIEEGNINNVILLPASLSTSEQLSFWSENLKLG